MRLNNKRGILLTLVLIVALVNSACPKDKVREAAKASDRLATLIGELINLKRELGPSGQTCQVQKVCISAQEELTLTGHLLAANTQVKQFNEFARKQTANNPQVRLDLATAFQKVTDALKALSSSAVFPVKNAQAKQQLLAIIDSVNASVQIIDTALKS